jgi:PLP dependent protein
MPPADPHTSNAAKDAMNGAGTLPQCYERVKARLRLASSRSGPEPGAAEVILLAVSKTQPFAAIRELATLGQPCFGENYVQEGIEKIQQAQAEGLALQWHLIGPLQSNKTRLVAEHFDWVQTVDRLKIGQRLAEQRPPDLAPLQVCVQVNISDEASKSGCSVEQAPELVQSLLETARATGRITLRGLMAVPQANLEDPELADQFVRMRHLFEIIKATLPQPERVQFDTLSMGMTQDLESAIACGSTMVRVGSAIFGVRAKPKPPEQDMKTQGTLLEGPSDQSSRQPDLG